MWAMMKNKFLMHPDAAILFSIIMFLFFYAFFSVMLAFKKQAHLKLDLFFPCLKLFFFLIRWLFALYASHGYQYYLLIEPSYFFNTTFYFVPFFLFLDKYDICLFCFLHDSLWPKKLILYTQHTCIIMTNSYRNLQSYCIIKPLY